MIFLYDDANLAFSQNEPLPANWTVKQGLDAYMLENGFEIAHYDLPKTPASFFGIGFSVPNPPKHRRLIMLHDLHHVATGFGTNNSGEGQISAWEISRGLKGTGAYVGLIVLSGALLGLITAPRATVRLLRSGGNRRSLFNTPELIYDDLLLMSIGELRVLLGLSQTGLYEGKRGLDSRAPKQD